MTRSRYQVVLQKPVLKMVRFIPHSVVRRIYERIASLAFDPIPPDAKPIQGHKGYFRIRIVDYRIVYEVAHTIRIITIVRIGHRKNVYVGI